MPFGVPPPFRMVRKVRSHTAILPHHHEADQTFCIGVMFSTYGGPSCICRAARRPPVRIDRQPTASVSGGYGILLCVSGGKIFSMDPFQGIEIIRTQVGSFIFRHKTTGAAISAPVAFTGFPGRDHPRRLNSSMTSTAHCRKACSPKVLILKNTA